MTKTTSELNVLQAMFLFLSLEFLSFDFVSEEYGVGPQQLIDMERIIANSAL